MTPKKIFNTDPSIREKVMHVYPVTRGEKKCAMEKAKREMKRAELAKRIYDEQTRISE